MQRFTVLSGCSGGGKSTLLAALATQGFATIPEPGRRIVTGPDADLPRRDPAGFARKAMDLALADWHGAEALAGRVFFDRGLGDAVAAYQHATGKTPPEAAGLGARYHRQVFMVPPWPDIYATDAARKHGFPEAVAEYDRLCAFYPQFGYSVVTVPKMSVAERVTFVLSHLED